jgi:hypothetical protein
VNINLPNDLHNKLKERAATDYMPVTTALALAVTRYLQSPALTAAIQTAPAGTTSAAVPVAKPAKILKGGVDPDNLDNFKGKPTSLPLRRVLRQMTTAEKGDYLDYEYCYTKHIPDYERLMAEEGFGDVEQAEIFAWYTAREKYKKSHGIK